MKRGALAVAPFRRLALAWTFTNFGDSALYLTLAIWVKDLTGSDASTGLVFFFLGLPVFLAPLAGHLADRLPRRRLVVGANLVAAGGVMVLAFVHDASDVWIVYAVTFGYGWLTYVTSACGTGLVRDLLPDEHLAGANGLLNTVDQGLRLLSPLVGAALYTAFGGAAIAALTAVSLVAAAFVVATIHVVESEPTPSHERSSFAVELAAGFRHIRRTSGLAQLTLWLAVGYTITGFATTTVFATIDRGLGRGSDFFAILASVQGAGAIAGGITAATVIKRLGETNAISIGLGLLGIGIATQLGTSTTVLLCGTFGAGVAIPWVFVSYTTLRQRATPGQLQGRVSSAANMAFNGPQTAATAAGAALIAVVDYRFLVMAMTIVLVGSAVMVSRTPPTSTITATMITPRTSSSSNESTPPAP